MDSFVFNAKVIANAKTFQIMEFDSRAGMRLRVKAKPQQGQANQEIERELKKKLQTNVSILRGKTAARKTIRLALDEKTAIERIQKIIKQ